ncbi:peptide deformylase [Fusibacter tunisiensis]|uniref:Peptide deformylase n=1 Tax=Fusibacter tunisiensis TaxID=1008308 RepID=A0ABS2MMA1_9FIRM|nr:peptide deformylase [Fusibacter tunisiensis]MBM7560535.1 peptide deformylase [Fusibacter tunisiensis]
MAIRTIRTDDDPVLRKKCRVVTEFDDRLRILVEDMIETLHYADGVGLAAPQIGILKRVVVIDLYDDKGPVTLINPRLLASKGSQIEQEGCLSLPGQSGYVERPSEVRVAYEDLNGESHEIEGQELLARALCHEMDHLEGVLYIDKAIPESELDIEEVEATY